MGKNTTDTVETTETVEATTDTVKASKKKINPLQDRVSIEIAALRGDKPTYVSVGVNDYSAVIRRGEIVNVPRFIIPVLKNSGEYVIIHEQANA